jgi:hypothetical protein
MIFRQMAAASQRPDVKRLPRTVANIIPAINSSRKGVIWPREYVQPIGAMHT